MELHRCSQFVNFRNICVFSLAKCFCMRFWRENRSVDKRALLERWKADAFTKGSDLKGSKLWISMVDLSMRANRMMVLTVELNWNKAEHTMEVGIMDVDQCLLENKFK